MSQECLFSERRIVFSKWLKAPMKVKDFIALLDTLDPELTVVINDDDEPDFGHITERHFLNLSDSLKDTHGQTREKRYGKNWHRNGESDRHSLSTNIHHCCLIH